MPSHSGRDIRTPFGYVPDLDSVIQRAGCNNTGKLARVRCHSHAQHEMGVSLDDPHALPGLEIPHAYGVVIGHREQVLAAGMEGDCSNPIIVAGLRRKLVRRWQVWEVLGMQLTRVLSFSPVLQSQRMIVWSLAAEAIYLP